MKKKKSKKDKRIDFCRFDLKVSTNPEESKKIIQWIYLIKEIKLVMKRAEGLKTDGTLQQEVFLKLRDVDATISNAILFEELNFED